MPPSRAHKNKVSAASAPSTDRGRRRRAEILEAAISVVADRGVGALTHRAVATRARVPLAATTYYFKSKSDLLIESFRKLTDDRVQALDAAIALLPAGLSPDVAAALWANAVEENMTHERARVVAEYEMHLDVSRTPELRSLHKAWEDKAMEYFTAAMRAMKSPYPEADAALVLSVLTGLQIGEIADPTPELQRTLVAPLLRRLLYALAPIS